MEQPKVWNLLDSLKGVKALIAKAAQLIGFRPNEVLLGMVEVLERKLDQLTSDGVNMPSGKVFHLTAEIREFAGKVETAVERGLAKYVVEKSIYLEREIAKMWDRSFATRMYFKTEYAALEALAETFGDLVEKFEADNMSAKDLILQAYEFLPQIVEGIKGIEDSIVTHRRKIAEKREAERFEHLEREVAVVRFLTNGQIKALLEGRPVRASVPASRGRSAEKREMDRARRAQMKGGSIKASNKQKSA